MKKMILFCFLFCAAFASPILDRSLDPAVLSELTTGLGIAPDADLVAETQKRWLRKAGSERWEAAELAPEQKAFVLDWAVRHHFYDEWTPSRPFYEKVLILGATTHRMQTRLEYLNKLWDHGLRFGEIVWLVGDRPLDARADGFIDRCKTESEAAHIIWDAAELPEEMRDLPVLFIETPMIEKQGELKRPNTQDTIYAWLERDLDPCVALFISDQPFCGYQYAIINQSLPESFLFDVAGRSADPSSHPAAAAITLDSIARWIYAEK